MDKLLGYTVYFADSDPGEFSRAQAANKAVAQALAEGHDVVVVNDADTISTPSSLRNAIDRTRLDGRPRLPYDKYVLMDQPQTESYLKSPVWSNLPDEPEYVGSVSGVLVFRSDSWLDIGGFDERYRGWGHEDNDMAARAGFDRVPGRVWSLYHQPDDRSVSDPRNLRIYRETYGLT